MKHIVILQGHPDTDPLRLCRGLESAYSAAAQSAGHKVDRFDVATIELPFLTSQHEFEQGDLPAALHPLRDVLSTADHVVLIWPLWQGLPPARLKLVLEQLLRPGVAFRYAGAGRTMPMLRGRSARMIVTMGMPSWFYRLRYGAAGVQAVVHNILQLVGMRPIHTTFFGLAGASETRRARWFDKVRRLGAQAR